MQILKHTTNEYAQFSALELQKLLTLDIYVDAGFVGWKVFSTVKGCWGWNNRATFWKRERQWDSSFWRWNIVAPIYGLYTSVFSENGLVTNVLSVAPLLFNVLHGMNWLPFMFAITVAIVNQHAQLQCLCFWKRRRKASASMFAKRNLFLEPEIFCMALNFRRKKRTQCNSMRNNACDVMKNTKG